MYSLIFKQFMRSRAVQLSFLLVLIIGVVSILIGKQFLAQQQRSIATVTAHQKEHIERNVSLNDDIGLVLYYVRFALIDQPDKLTALSIGQRDVNPSMKTVTIRTLEAQKYDTELNNPSVLHSGNLDLGFVILYLFPLLIIAFSFNLLSEENETGTWRLVAIQSRSIFRFLLWKLSVRAGLVYAALLVLFGVAIALLALPVDQSLLAFVVASVLYLAFWFSLCFLVVSFHRSSSFNVLVLLSLWVVLAILLPASTNNYLTNRYPVPEALAAMVKQRDGYHEKWDMDRKLTMDKFYAHYPQFEKYGVPAGNFSWLWYYAMQQMGDDESMEESRAMREQVLQRERASRSLALAIPTMHTQLLFNDLARTSLSDYMKLLDQTGEFHERLRLYFYPKIFEEKPAKGEDWSSIEPEHLAVEAQPDWQAATLPFLVLIAIGVVLGMVNLKRHRVIS